MSWANLQFRLGNTIEGVACAIVSIKQLLNLNEVTPVLEEGLNILSKLGNNKTYITVELTTGDEITPREIKFSYNSIFEDKKIPIMAYNIETILAEKFHSIVSRGVLNTRLKDFYDVYILFNFKKDIIDTKTPEGANESFYPSFYVIIDSTEHLDYVVEKLTEAGFQNIEYKTTIDYDMVRIILLSCYIITSLTLFIVIVITSFYVKKKLLNESSDIGIYKVFGFDKSIVRKLYILEILSLNLISFVLGLILFIILFLVLKFFTFSSLMFIGVNIHLNISSIIISLIIIIVFPIVLNIPKLTKKINSNIIDLIEGDDK